MDIGKLDKRITLQSRSTTTDIYGQPLNLWSDVATLWANIKYVGGREKLRSGVVDINIDVTIAVRYAEQISNVKETDGWRVVYVAREGTRYFSIVGSRDIEEERRFMIFDCVQGSEVQT